MYLLVLKTHGKAHSMDIMVLASMRCKYVMGKERRGRGGERGREGGGTRGHLLVLVP